MRDLVFECPLVHAVIEEWEITNLRRYWAEYGIEPREPIVRLDWLSKQAYIRAVAKAYEVETFVESGTYEGDMICAVLRPPTGIRTVLSVEIDEAKFEACRARFGRLPNVALNCASSVNVLRNFRSHNQTLWFLDGHANGPEDPDPAHFPLREELAEIFAADGCAGSGHVVVIDDCRFFGIGFWPTLEEIKNIVGDRGLVGEIESDLLRIEAYSPEKARKVAAYSERHAPKLRLVSP